MPRQPTDYNEPARQGRFVRTAKWWYAPENITPKAKKASWVYLFILGALLVTVLLATFLWPTSSPQVSEQGAALPAPPPVLLTSDCAPAEAVDFLPEQVVTLTPEPLWVLDGTMSRPTSPTGGPFSGDPFPRCYARTPEGALYAATSFATGVLSATDSGDLKPFFEVRASHTGNYTAMISTLPEVVPAEDRSQAAITGYRWNSYTPEQASLEIKFTATTGAASGQSVANLYTFTWENNDWLLVVPGRADVTQVPVDTNKTYIPWGTT